jgi:hypothetical protein
MVPAEVRRRLMDIMEIDDCVYAVCRDWYCSESLPLMYAVAYRHSNKARTVSLKRLLRELETTKASNTYPKKAPALEKAVDWVKGQIDTASVMEALDRLVARAKSVGIDAEDFEARSLKAWKGAL